MHGYFMAIVPQLLQLLVVGVLVGHVEGGLGEKEEMKRDQLIGILLQKIINLMARGERNMINSMDIRETEVTVNEL